MTSNETPNKSGNYSVGLSTARFLDQTILDETTTVSPNQSQTQSSGSVSKPSAAPAARSESDEDVNSYLQQLLRRSNQLAPLNEVHPLGAEENGSSEAFGRDGVRVYSAAKPAVNNPEDTWTTEQYTPKKQAPEREADLRAFRQLANASARGAVSSFHQKKLRRQSRTSGIVLAVSSTVAISLFLTSSQWGDIWSLCSFGTTAIAVCAAWHFFKFGGRVPSNS